jgi:colicin import membrane protein
VGGTCARCGELHASDARFCSHCGVNLEEAAAEAAEKARAEEAARAERAAAEKAEAEKASAANAEAAPKESSDGAGNGRPAVKADEAPAAETADAPTTKQPATEAADAPTTEQPPADEPATKPLA